MLRLLSLLFILVTACGLVGYDAQNDAAPSFVAADDSGHQVMSPGVDAALDAALDAAPQTARDAGVDAAFSRDAAEPADARPPLDAGAMDPMDAGPTPPPLPVVCGPLTCDINVEACCVASVAPFVFPDPSDYQCATQVDGCELVYGCASDLDCGDAEVCCGERDSTGRTVYTCSTATSCQQLGAIHLACTAPSDCTTPDETCCGTVTESPSWYYTETYCATGCGRARLDRTFCDEDADCNQFSRTCLDSTLLPGHRACDANW